MSKQLTKSEKIIRNTYSICSKVMPVNRKKVLFLTDIRKDIGGNYLPLYSALKDEGFEIICDFRSSKSKKESRKKRLRRAFHLATAGFIVLEDFHYDMEWITVRKNQELVQLWHAAGAFKKFAWSRNEAKKGYKISPAYEKTTKAIVSAEHIRKDYAEAFHMDRSRVLATGLPRTDVFFNKAYAESLRSKYDEKYPEMKGKKVIIFAPTYRGSSLKKASYGFDKIDLKGLDAAMEDDQIMVFKWHPAIAQVLKKQRRKALDSAAFDGRFLDLSEERDINDLMMISDMLITDYSSVIFEYELLHRPVIYYWYDVKDFREDRGFFYELDEYVYGKVAYDFDQLIAAIKTPDMCEEKRAEFHRKFMSACDGHATERVVDSIFLNDSARLHH